MGVQEEPLLAIHARSNSPGRRSSRKASAMAPKDLVNICAILLIVFTGVTFYQRVEVERSVARKNSARCELVYNEAQSEVALWRAKYDAEIVARAVHCDTNMTRKMEEALNVSSTLLASALADNQKLVNEIVKLNAHLRERHVDGTVDIIKLEELNQLKELTVRDR